MHKKSPMKNKLSKYWVYSFISSALIFGYGCINRHEITTENSLKVKTVRVIADSIQVIDTLKLSDIVDSCKFVQLQSPKEHPIGFINKLLFWNNEIFALDQRIAKKVYRFSSDGKFLQVIGNLGKGPGEYLRPDDVSIDFINQQLLIYSRQERKLLFFDLRTGSFLNELKLSFAASEIQPVNHEQFAVFNHDIHNLNNENAKNDYNITFYNHDFSKITYRHSSFTSKTGEGKSIYFTGRYFNNQDSTIYVNWRFNDTVYKVISNELRPALIFDFGSKRVRFTNYEESSANYILKRIKKGDFASLMNTVLISRGIFITQYMDVETPNIGTELQQNYLIGTLNLVSKPVSSKYISDDLYHIGFSFPVSTFKDSFVSVLYPDEIKEEQSSEILEKIAQKTYLDPRNNLAPILQFYKIKTHEK